MRRSVRIIGMTLSALLCSIAVTHAQIDLSSFIDTGAGPTSQNVVAAPSPIDILVDSDSYVPPFYRGRALPSAGTTIRLQAIPYFKSADGSSVPTSDIIFTWKQDDRVVGNVSGLGEASVILPAALLYGTTDIEVDAQSADNASFGTATVSVPSIVPPLTLYEDNPLLGITYYRAMSGDMAIADTEMTFAVVPYFAQAQSLNDPQFTYAWTVNGSSISPDPQDPSEITLNATNSTGVATIGLSLSRSDNIFLNSTGTWQLTLGTAASDAFTAGGDVKNPFTGQTQ
jgi:hypothetical protein